MRILHTSDWHIGRNLHNNPLDKDFEFFTNWLVNTIEDKNIDILLIAGDIFDVAFPSGYAQKQYYQALARLIRSGLRQIIIIAGNHDSANYLSAPKEILEALDIKIFAGLPGAPYSLIYPYPANDPEVVFAAVPYVRQVDLLKLTPEAKDIEGIQQTVASLYSVLFEKIRELYKDDIPAVATGHLYVVDGDFDDTDRENYSLGGLVDIPSKAFPPFDYIALGHVHRPMQLPGQKIFYSGNPFYMGFNDIRRKTERRVLIYDTGTRTVEPVKVPLIRDFVKFQGSIEQIIDQARKYQPQGEILPAFAQAIVTDYNQISAQSVIDTIRSSIPDYVKIIDFKIPPKNLLHQTTPDTLKSLKEMSELEIFKHFLDSQQDIPPGTKQELLDSFVQLLEEIKQA